MEKLRPVEEVVMEIRSRLPSQKKAIAMLQADRKALQEIIGRNVDRTLREFGCPERFLGIACCATVVFIPERIESERNRLGRVLYEAWVAQCCGDESPAEWNELTDTAQEQEMELADAVRLVLEKEDSDG